MHELTGPPYKSPLQLAAAGGHPEVMEELSRFMNTNDWRLRDDWGWTLLHEAAHGGRKDVIRWKMLKDSLTFSSFLMPVGFVRNQVS